jgi:hypothetical protein
LLLTRHFSSFCLIPLQETNPHFLQIPLLPAYTLQPCKKNINKPKGNDNWRAHQSLLHLMPLVQGILEIRARQPHLNQTFVLGMHGSSKHYLSHKTLQEIF